MRYVVGLPVTLGSTETITPEMLKVAETNTRISAVYCFEFEKNAEVYEQLPNIVPEPLLKMWSREHARRIAADDPSQPPA